MTPQHFHTIPTSCAIYLLQSKPPSYVREWTSVCACPHTIQPHVCFWCHAHDKMYQALSLTRHTRHIHIIRLTTESCWEDGIHQEHSKVRFFYLVSQPSHKFQQVACHMQTFALCVCGSCMNVQWAMVINANTKQGVSEEVVWLKLN